MVNIHYFSLRIPDEAYRKQLKSSWQSFCNGMQSFFSYSLQMFSCINSRVKQALKCMRIHIAEMFKLVNLKITTIFKQEYHQENMSVQFIPPLTPLLYSKTGVCRAIHIFLIFVPTHRLWVFVRTASARRF